MSKVIKKNVNKSSKIVKTKSATPLLAKTSTTSTTATHPVLAKTSATTTNPVLSKPDNLTTSTATDLANKENESDLEIEFDDNPEDEHPVKDILKITGVFDNPPIQETKSLDNPTAQDNTDQPDTDNQPDSNSDDSDDSDSDNSDTDVKAKKPKARITKKKTPSKKQPLVKKGPGRPRKIPKKEPIPRKGIVKSPLSPDYVVEFLYDSPLIIKKLVAFFKSMASSQIQILFRPTDIILYAKDHHKKSKIYIRIDAQKINHYYCKNILDIAVSAKDLESILNKVDKEYSDIILISSNGNTQKNMTLILENAIQIDENHTIDLIGQYDHLDNEHEFINEDYTIKFEWPGKYFRKTIGDIKSISTQLSISQEDNTSPLKICYTSANKKIHSEHIVKNADKIKFQSKLRDNDSFRVDVKVDYIKPISSAHIADDIIIMVDENKKFMTKAYIDNGTIEIKTLTEIIDERPDDD